MGAGRGLDGGTAIAAIAARSPARAALGVERLARVAARVDLAEDQAHVSQHDPGGTDAPGSAFLEVPVESGTEPEVDLTVEVVASVVVEDAVGHRLDLPEGLAAADRMDEGEPGVERLDLPSGVAIRPLRVTHGRLLLWTIVYDRQGAGAGI